MKITYDKNVDALYIELKTGAYDRTKKVTGDILVDINKRGKILGIEILDASKNLPAPKSELYNMNFEIFKPSLKLAKR